MPPKKPVSYTHLDVYKRQPLEEPKNPDTCKIFALYKLLANEEQIATMRQNYIGGNYGYGHAKQALFELICEKFKTEREKYNYYLSLIHI